MGQLVHPGTNTASYPTANDMDGIKAWMIGVAAAAAYVASTNAYKNFVSGPFSSWNASYQAGRALEPPPGVPMGFDALMSDDGMDYELVPSIIPAGPPPEYTKTAPAFPSTGIKTTVSAPLLIGQVGVPITQRDGTLWVRLS